MEMNNVEESLLKSLNIGLGEEFGITHYNNRVVHYMFKLNERSQLELLCESWGDWEYSGDDIWIIINSPESIIYFRDKKERSCLNNE